MEDFCKNGNYSKNNLFIEAVKEKVERETGKNFDRLSEEMQISYEVRSVGAVEDPDTESGEE